MPHSPWKPGWCKVQSTCTNHFLKARANKSLWVICQFNHTRFLHFVRIILHESCYQVVKDKGSLDTFSIIEHFGVTSFLCPSQESFVNVTASVHHEHVDNFSLLVLLFDLKLIEAEELPDFKLVLCFPYAMYAILVRIRWRMLVHQLSLATPLTPERRCRWYLRVRKSPKCVNLRDLAVSAIFALLLNTSIFHFENKLYYIIPAVLSIQLINCFINCSLRRSSKTKAFHSV